MAIEDIFNRHKRATLLYSGGKDSLCCLLLLKPYWDRVDVVWVNTGNVFPETLQHIEKVRAAVPHFLELKSDSLGYAREHGLPVDVVATRHTDIGRFSFGATDIHVCSRFDCCRANLWEPLAAYMATFKPTCVIRGDRGDEREMGPTQMNGTEFVFPIFDWGIPEVMGVICRDSGLLAPQHFLREGSSLDCFHCTAYTKDYVARREYLKHNHPKLYAEMEEFHRKYRAAVLEELNQFKE